MTKFFLKIFNIILLLCISFASYSQIITTIAGNGIFGYSGDGGQATNSELDFPCDVAADASGNVYIADDDNNRIRIVSTSGIINTFAGNGYGEDSGYGGYSGDGGPATAAELNHPYDVTLDTSGNVYISEHDNNRIRIVNTSGIISTIAGNGYGSPGTGGFSGDGGPATNAELGDPAGIALDVYGNIYIADEHNSRIRKINSSGIISTIAGNGVIGYSGDTGPATNAEFNNITDVAVDTYGNVYIADAFNNVIRKVDTSGIISDFAGNSTGSYAGDGGQATLAELNYPYGVASDNYGNIYISDVSNYRIRMVNTSGIITTYAGSGFQGFSGDGGPATAANIYSAGVKSDAFGNVYIGDEFNNRIRKVTTGTTTGINTISGSSDEIEIFPIPTKAHLTISGISPGQTIELYNYLGQKVLSARLGGPSANFDISNQPNGIYLIKILNKDGSPVTEKKIVKTE